MAKNLKGKELGKGISQRKDGRYSARFVIGNKRVEKYFDTLQEARYWLDEARYKSRTGHVVAFPKKTVDAWFDFWIENIKTPAVSPNTLRNYRERYQINIRPVIGGMQLSDVKPTNCQLVLSKMAAKYAGSTIQQTFNTMYGLFEAAVEHEIIDKNPVTKAVKNPKQIIKKTRCLTKDEERRFLAAAEGTSNYPQYRFLLETGLRTSEMIGLRWSDIDFEKRTISVSRNLEYRYSTQEWRFGPTKSKAGNRVIPMTDACYQLLLDLREKRRKSRVAIADPRFKDIVFINRKGLPTKNSTYDSHLYKLADKAGIPRFSMHVLRHTFATRCVEADMNTKTLQVILGHSNFGITMNTYVHPPEDQKHREIQKLAEYRQLEALG